MVMAWHSIDNNHGVKFNKMEVIKQELGPDSYENEIEIENNGLDSFKYEIKEESILESTTDDTYDFLVLKEFPIKSEIEQDGNKLINKEGFTGKNKGKIMKTLFEHSSHKGHYMSQYTEGKTVKKHIKVQTRQECYNCEICLKKFSQTCKLKRHLMVHTGEKSYKCEICFKLFSQAAHLKTHLIVHTEEKPYKCEICFKQFSVAGNLKAHLVVHTEEKPYKCEICFKEFSLAGNLKTHLRVHTGEKPYKCEFCFKQFGLASNLKRHLRVHTE